MQTDDGDSGKSLRGWDDGERFYSALFTLYSVGRRNDFSKGLRDAGVLGNTRDLAVSCFLELGCFPGGPSESYRSPRSADHSDQNITSEAIIFWFESIFEARAGLKILLKRQCMWKAELGIVRTDSFLREKIK